MSDEENDQDLLEACCRRYNSLFAYYKNKYKKIRRRKIALDLTIFFISSGGIAGSIVTATPVIALITAGGILMNKLAESLKYNKKLVILKKIIKELKSIIDEIEGYKRGNIYKNDRFLMRTNQVDSLITTLHEENEMDF